MLGLYKEMSPRFLKIYADLAQTITTALTEFRQEVENSAFPTAEHSYTIEDGELQNLLAQLH
jgi:3-methyl-2-oxobutanoate hydroxymethyltransferase